MADVRCVCCGRSGWTRTSAEDLCHPCQYEAGHDYCFGMEGHDLVAKAAHCQEVWKMIMERVFKDVRP